MEVTESTATPQTVSHEELSSLIAGELHWVRAVQQEMAEVVVGQQELVNRLLIGLLTNGHVLLEGVPGLAKTLTVNALAGAIQGSFQRIQFTPDLLPADLVGTLIFNPKTTEFTPKLGPIFANVILADEINRAPAKVQSALLEAMQEKQVTVGETTYPLPNPFLVLATQNPIDQEGTYTLPEAQLDRFLFKVMVDYPSAEEERLILDRMASSSAKVDTSPVVECESVLRARQIVDAVYLDSSIKDYIVRIIHNTRNAGELDKRLGAMIRAGASPRGTINLAQAAKAVAFLEGRSYVVPEDVKSLACDILRHRILLSYEAEAEQVSPESVVGAILSKTIVP